MTIEVRLRRVMAAVFPVDVVDLKDTDSTATIAEWDSVGHLQLMMALEAEFGIAFSPDEMAELTSLGAIRRHLAESMGD